MKTVFYINNFKILECVVVKDTKFNKWLVPIENAFVYVADIPKLHCYEYKASQVFTTKSKAKRYLIGKINEL